MRTTLSFAVLALFSSLSVAEEVWPMRFVWEKGQEHTLVLLYEDGKAAFSSRQIRPDQSQWYFVAARARWTYCDGSAPRNRPQCISVHVEGYSNLRDGEFRFDYSLDGDTLTEMNKDGPGIVLKRYCDHGEAGCASNTVQALVERYW